MGQAEIHLSRAEFARRIDHTLLKATATGADIDRLCDEALRFDFWRVCVAPCNVRRAKERLDGSKVKVCTVVGFPLGSDTASIKLAQAVKGHRGRRRRNRHGDEHRGVQVGGG